MPSDRFNRLSALLLFLGVLAVFWPVTRADYFNFDDPVFIQMNRRLDGGFTWTNVRWAFTANLTYFSPTLEYWSPLTALSRLLDVTLWGKDPPGHHAMSLVLHGLSAVVLFAALRRFTGRAGVALFVAAVFAMHPVVVEPVAWLSARKDVIYGLFWNLTLLAYAIYQRKPDRRRYLILLGAFGLAAMSKPMVLTLPCVLLLLDLWPGARILAPGTPGFWRSLRQPLLEKLPLFAVSLLLAWLAMFSQRGWHAVVPDSMMPLPGRLANVLYAYCEYLRLVAWPAGLSPFHPFVAINSLLQIALALLVLVGISALVLWQVRQRPWLAVGWFWFCGVIFPVSGIIQIGASRMAERYLYMALPGLALAVTWQVLDLVERRSPTGGRGAARPLAALSLALVLLMSALSNSRARQWQDPLGVWKQSAQLYPLSSTVLLQYANAAWSLRDYKIAGPLYGKVLSLDPQNGSAMLGLARLVRVTGNLPRAADVYEKSFELSPEIPQTQLEYAQVLAELGRDEEARGILDKLCQRLPYHPEAWQLNARLQYRNGDSAAALASMEQGWKAIRAQSNAR